MDQIHLFSLNIWITNSLSIATEIKAIEFEVPSHHSTIFLVLKFPKERKEEV